MTLSREDPLRYAIADIHGGSKTFKALLERIRLKPSDQLILLGDYVDRGQDSKGVLDTIISLQESGYTVTALRGNHDDMLLRTAIGRHDEFSEQYLLEWGWHTLLSFGCTSMLQLPDRYIRLIDSMPYLHYDSDYIFLHAGLNREADKPLTESDHIDMLWSRWIWEDTARLGNRTIVSGHTIKPVDTIRNTLFKPHILLDNGGFTSDQPEFGNLVALNLDTKELHLQPWIDGESFI